MANFVRAYLSTTTSSKDLENSQQLLKNFADKHHLQISDFYIESKPNGVLASSELLRLTHDIQQGDIILIENTSVFLALNISLWRQLSVILKDKAIRVVVADIEATWLQLDGKIKSVDIAVMDALLIEVLNSVAEREVARVKQSQAAGIRKAQLQGKYRGRKPDVAQYKKIIKCLSDGKTYKEIERELHCSSRTIISAKKWHESKQG